MVQTIQTKFKDGQIIINNDIDIPNDSPILVSYINNIDKELNLKATEISLDKIWNNQEDDIYEQSINKANFKDNVMELSEKIQKEWWETHKSEYMSGTGIDL